MSGVASESGGRRQRESVRAILGQAVAHLCLALPGLALYLIVIPRIAGFSTLGNLLDLLLMAIPFVLSVSFLAQFASLWFRRRETAVLLFIAASLPLFFTVGVSWPVEAIPNAIREASRAFPSTSAIDGLVRINQMGASLYDVAKDWASLWALVAIYGSLTIGAALVFRRRGVGHGS
jgi:ABC-2 type transport system permease protein